MCLSECESESVILVISHAMERLEPGPHADRAGLRSLSKLPPALAGGLSRRKELFVRLKYSTSESLYVVQIGRITRAKDLCSQVARRPLWRVALGSEGVESLHHMRGILTRLRCNSERATHMEIKNARGNKSHLCSKIADQMK